MALTNATLTVKVVESLTLNGNSYGGTTTKTFTVDEVLKRIVLCPASVVTTLVTFAAAVSTDASKVNVDEDFVEYIRITNLDGTNPVTLDIIGDASLAQYSLGAGESFLLHSTKSSFVGEADTTSSASLADVVSIQADPGGNPVECDIFVAGKNS